MNDLDEGIPIDNCYFFVGRTPQVFWGTELREKNLDFLRGLDPDYYEYVAKVNFEKLGGADRLFAAAAIRLAYGQALETLAALIAASLQAEEFPLGWLLSYKNHQLDEILHDVRSSRDDYLNWPANGNLLEALARSMLRPSGLSAVEQDTNAVAFAKCWERWVDDFLKSTQRNEYNALKHGSRASLGGFLLALGPGVLPGQEVNIQNLTTVTSSEFGSSFFVPKNISGPLHRRPIPVHRNWSVTYMGDSLSLISLSIKNLCSWLRVVGGDDAASCLFAIPEDPSCFEVPWREGCGGSAMEGGDYSVEKEHIKSVPKEDIVSELRSRYQAQRSRREMESSTPATP